MNIFIVLLIIPICNAFDVNYCSERKCSSSTNEWCCFHNATCGLNSTCNDIDRTVGQSRCPGGVSCTSGHTRWCCEKGQTCNDFQKCSDDGPLVTLIIIICSTIGFAIVTFSCICCIYKYHRKRDNSIRRFGLRIANASAIMNSLRFSTMRSTPVTQVFIIATADKPTDNREESPPSYGAVTTPPTETNQNLI